MKKGIIDAVEMYPTSTAAKAHGEKLWQKHWPVIARFEDAQDVGRVHAITHCVAMLKDAGEHTAADKVEQFLNWMCEPAKPRKEVKSIADNMAGG